ncbi:LTA synthase family protein [Streptococcus suis]|uniref:LTA synthase family protein n=1 Tax=Streptococcus suis TaxID=1307 RepID=UPI0023D82936|nr:sulfatase-like hydrolase/transferase [Streptococcus suis]
MKLIKQLIHILISIGLIGSFFLYAHLIQNELGSTKNDGTIEIIAEQPNQVIDSIQINGRYIHSSEIIENQWGINDADLIPNFSSLGEENSLIIKSSSSVRTLSFEYFVSENPTIVKIKVGGQLVESVDTSTGDKYKNLAFIELPYTLGITKDNQFWYLHLIVLALGLSCFILNGSTWRIKRRHISILTILLITQYIFTTFTFPRLYRNELVLFNSSFNKMETQQLLVALTYLIFFSLLGYKQLRGHISKAFKTTSLSVIYLLVPIFSLFIIENSYSQFSTLSPNSLWNNLIIIGVLYLILVFTTNLRFASLLILSASVFIGISNQLLIDSRGAPLLFYNLFQITDGLNVASSVAININNRMLQSMVFSYILLTFFFFIPKLYLPKLLPSRTFYSSYDFKWPKRFSRILLGYITLITIVPMINKTVVSNANISLNYWRMYVTYGQFGLPLSLASFYEDSKITKPDGYSVPKLNEVLEKYSPETEKQTIRPNIIFIQNESQSDFSSLQDLNMEPDPLSNQHALTDNTVHGTLNVSVFGGGTANTEYEVLTSNPISLLSSNLFPYQQIITQERPSFASYLKDKNYETVALHPQSGNNYNRHAVYPLLGFNKSYFLDSEPAISSLAPLTINRGWPSDQFLFNGIKELYAQKGDQPLFSFVVTMQGHGGYPSTEEIYPREVSINGSTSEYLAETEFLTSMKKTDEAFADLITFFSTYKEPTIIVMYGDHQPSLSQEFYAQFMDENNPAAKYSTPFVIWSNFDIKERESTTISPNYLVPYLMDILSESDYALPRSPYQQFLSDMQIEAPIITSWGNIDNNGQQIEDLSTLPLYQTYLQLEYNSAIDKQPLTDLYE